MQPSNGTGPDHGSGVHSKRFRAAIPLAAGLILLGLFVYFLLTIGGRDEEREDPSSPKSPFPKVVEPRIPDRIDPQPKGPPPEKGLDRWHFDREIVGWDPALASKIAAFFEAMDVPYGPEGFDHAKLGTLEEKREGFAKFLASLGPEAIPTLTAILGEEKDFVDRRFLLYALGDLGPKSELASEALYEFYDKSKKDPQAAGEINHVIEAMGRLKNERAFQILSLEIDDPNTPTDYRDKFIQALGEHPRRDEAVPKIVGIMNEYEDPKCRNHAAQFLGKVAKPETLGDLTSAFGREKELIIQQTILGSIGKIGDESALPFLTGVARRGERYEVRLSAANAIRRIGTPNAIQSLQELLQVETEPQVRKNLEEWLQVTADKR